MELAPEVKCISTFTEFTRPYTDKWKWRQIRISAVSVGEGGKARIVHCKEETPKILLGFIILHDSYLFDFSFENVVQTENKFVLTAISERDRLGGANETHLQITQEARACLSNQKPIPRPLN